MLVLHTSNSFVIVLVYVDDILMTVTNSNFISHVKAIFDKTFTIKDLGLVQYYLGLEISRTSEGIYLHQHKFIHDMLVEAGLDYN